MLKYVSRHGRGEQFGKRCADMTLERQIRRFSRSRGFRPPTRCR